MEENQMLHTIGGWEIPGGGIDLNVVISALTVSVVLCFVALFAMRKVEAVPRGGQALFEHIFNWLDNLAIGMMGPIGRRYVPLCMGIFLYILVSNWIGLIPNVFEWIHDYTQSPQTMPLVSLLEPPTVSANITLAFALISFFAFIFLGIARSIERASGHGHDHQHDHGQEDHDHAHGEGGGFMGGIVNWLGHYIQPVPSLWASLDPPLKYFLVPLLLFLFLFLNIVEEVARIISLTFRLYGNIFGEHQVKVQFAALCVMFEQMAVKGIVAGAAGLVAFFGFGIMTIVMWASLLFVLCLGTLAGFIQAFVFALLTMIYIAHAVADHH
ncbi:MAG: F0F1 ATP synthase subunit A [Candidatus Xenobia bacterium]